MRQIFLAVSAILLFAAQSTLPCQAEPVSIVQSMTGKWYQVERSNWSQYRNGKYIGLTHRETRTTLTAETAGGRTSRFAGFCYVLEETLRDMRNSAQGLDDVHPVSFILASDGRMTIKETDSGYPRLRNFPLLPADPVVPGDRWEGESLRIIDPRNSGKTTRMPIQVAYEFVGEEQYKGHDVFRIKAKYATRINKYRKLRSDDADLESATGTHDIDILIARESGAMVLMLDIQDETFFYADGSSVRYRGSTAVFGEVPAPVDRAAIIRAAAPYGVAEPSRETFSLRDTPPQPGKKPSGEDMPAAGREPPAVANPRGGLPEDAATDGASAAAPFMMEETEQGVRLSLRDIRFVADSADILPEEAWRLDAIAETLQAIPGGRFLVEGHTADVGNPAGEKALSVERAERIIRELSRRGIPEDQCIFTGYGGTRPVADNSTAEGRAQNRRVEITILD